MRRYLVVDDNQAFAENISEILEEQGTVDIVHSGRGALELVAKHRYTVILSDMRMPVMNGAELIHQIHRIDADVPAIVITAYTTDNDLLSARQEGLLAVLPKPAPVSRLLELTRSARRGGLIAIVEDDINFADNLSEILRSSGFAVVTATSVLETERMGGIRPFAALVDMRVPGGGDGEAMMRLHDRFPQLPILAMTGHDIVPPGAPYQTFFKPFDPAALLQTVEQLYESTHHGKR